MCLFVEKRACTNKKGLSGDGKARVLNILPHMLRFLAEIRPPSRKPEVGSVRKEGESANLRPSALHPPQLCQPMVHLFWEAGPFWDACLFTLQRQLWKRGETQTGHQETDSVPKCTTSYKSLSLPEPQFSHPQNNPTYLLMLPEE